MIPLIDLHTHILPALDDGPADAELAMEMLRIARDDGIRTLCLTPHYHPARGFDNVGAVQAFEALRERAEREFPTLTLLLGSEIFFHGGFADTLAEGKCHTMNGSKHVLLEFDPEVERITVENALLWARSKGFLPIVAHIERYECVQRNPGIAERIAENGFAIQINASSVLGGAGFRIKRLAKKLLTRHLVTVISSDAHDPIHRPPRLHECYRFIARKYGKEYANELFCYAPADILGI